MPENTRARACNLLHRLDAMGATSNPIKYMALLTRAISLIQKWDGKKYKRIKKDIDALEGGK